MTLVVNINHWLDKDGDLPTDNPRLRPERPPHRALHRVRGPGSTATRPRLELVTAGRTTARGLPRRHRQHRNEADAQLSPGGLLPFECFCSRHAVSVLGGRRAVRGLEERHRPTLDDNEERPRPGRAKDADT